ncbi:hypothetical protein BLNAU_10734 [Blattamonas nauphoetae]|uniref:Uncharacterized protein n=2 Tax=Blattamonas nauphoetae TaxID=2049346 RepID=A0ABQ9XT01_9EUKA|nr:hypothetical protein BLNAU_10734 [Blattamonas nauphoetae]
MNRSSALLSVPLLQRSISFLLHPLDCIRFTCVEGTHSFFVRVIAQICVSASKLATDLDWNQDPRLSLLFQFLVSFRRAQHQPEAEVVLLAAHCHPSLPLLPFSTHLQRRLANKRLKRKQRQAKDKRRKIHPRRKEEKNKRQMVVNQKRRKTKTQLLNQTKWNRIRSVRLPNTLPDTSHHTPCHSNHNVQSPPDFDAEWHSYSHVWDLVDTIVFLGGWMENEEEGRKQNDRVGKSDERGEKERKKVVVKFMIDSLLSFIRKEMKTRTIKLVTLNPTRIVDNAQSELIVVFFPPLCSTGLDETKRAPNAFEMSVVGFDEFSIEPLFVTAGEKSMLLNSHLKTTRMSVGEEVEEGREEEGGST